MKQLFLFAFTLSLSALLVSCASAQKGAPPAEAPIAFPHAEGFGRWATGGRGGAVVIVTSLDDDGPGSLREAVNTEKPKIVVFEVSGTIRLRSPLKVKANTTIAGQTAPGDGICIADHPVSLIGDNIIVRYMRFRLGDRYQNKGMVHGSGHDDALSVSARKHIIIDHCSLSWSNDEVMSAYGGDSTTIQWNIIAEPLNYSYHFEKGDTDFENHGYGGIWGGRHLSAHHNLFAHCVSRTPRFGGMRNGTPELVDYRNNVIYNWSHNNVYGGEGGLYNIVGNYYKAGPATQKKVRQRIVNPSKLKSPVIPFGSYYVAGNFVEGAPGVTADNSLGVHMPDATAEEKAAALIAAPVPFHMTKTQAAPEAYASVLQQAGASFRRDTLDARIVRDVERGTGRIIDVQGGFPHGTPFEATVSAWPALAPGVPKADTDRDGMPDDWEKSKGLDPHANDAGATKLHAYFTNIEVYINSITQ